MLVGVEVEFTVERRPHSVDRLGKLLQRAPDDEDAKWYVEPTDQGDEVLEVVENEVVERRIIEVPVVLEV